MRKLEYFLIKIVNLCPINVKTAEPIEHDLFVTTHLTLEKFYKDG